MALLLEVKDLMVDYGSVRAVRGVSFSVDKGEAIGIVGPNGAGKSSTLAAIAGLVPARGQVLLNGKSLLGLKPEDVVRAGVSLVPEGRRIFGTLTVLENLQLGATIRRAQEARVDIDALFDRFPILRTYAHSRAGSLSGGEQQQLAIARALLSTPALVIMDEPSLGLSPLMVKLLFDILDDLRRDGVTVVLVEQHVQRTLRFADRSYVLVNGRFRAEGTAETLSGSKMEEAYLGQAATQVIDKSLQDVVTHDD